MRRMKTAVYKAKNDPRLDTMGALIVNLGLDVKYNRRACRPGEIF
jgi:hypothetical protein